MKTLCPVTRSQFNTSAQAITVVAAGVEHAVETKAFSTGSLGWYASTKQAIIVDGVKCQVQVGLTFTVIGSKELPADAPATSQPAAPAAKPSAPAKAPVKA